MVKFPHLIKSTLPSSVRGQFMLDAGVRLRSAQAAALVRSVRPIPAATVTFAAALRPVTTTPRLVWTVPLRHNLYGTIAAGCPQGVSFAYFGR
jgi:hypothetical protein